MKRIGVPRQKKDHVSTLINKCNVH